MIHARNVTGPAARSAALAAALLTALPMNVQAQPAPPPAAAPAPAVAAPRSGLSESVAAVVNDDIISTYDLAQRMRLLIATSGVQPTQETLPQFQQEALVSLVDEHLQLQELRRVEKEQKFSIIASDEEVQQELAGMAKQDNLSTEAFLGQLAARGISLQTLTQQIRAQMSWQRWISGRYGSRLRIGDDQISVAMAKATADASKPQYQISEVLIDPSRVGGLEAATNGARQLIGQLQQGAPFGAVARQFSSAPTAAAGGDVGWINAAELPAEVAAVIEQMRPGQLSQPIPSNDGVYIIYLRDKRAGSGATLVNLKQAAIALPADASDADVAAARTKLEALRGQAQNCAGLDAAAARVDGVVAADLGEAELSDLLPEFRDATQALNVGQISTPVRTRVGLHILAVCGKRASGDEEVTRDQIENRLVGQQLTMISRRYMRDLRNSATIETR